MIRLTTSALVLFCLALVTGGTPAVAQSGGDCVWKCDQSTDTARCQAEQASSLGGSACTEIMECRHVGFQKVGDGPSGYWQPIYDCKYKCELEYNCVWV